MQKIPEKMTNWLHAGLIKIKTDSICKVQSPYRSTHHEKQSLSKTTLLTSISIV